MHEIQKAPDGYRVTAGSEPEFLTLPSGEIIRPRNVEAIRVQPEKADRVSGEVAARVHIEHRSSWFTVRFDHERDARDYAAALGELCDRIAKGDANSDLRAGVGRRDARAFIDNLRGPSDPDARPHAAIEAALDKVLGEETADAP